MNNIIPTKKINAIFLAAVLVVGTFAAISPSIIKGTNAQTELYNYGTDTGYSNYEPKYGMDNYDKKSYGNDRDYGMDNYDKKSYGNDRDYGMDNYDKKSYGNDRDYGMDNYDKKSYGNDRDYGMDNYDKKSYGNEPKYPSYGEKDDKRDKSKDSKSVNINKFNCINTNININGNNTGNISIGNKGQGSLGGYSSNYGSGYNGNEDYYSDNGYDNNKQGKGFECIINNNNNNTNIVTGGAGNVTDGNGGNVTDECLLCFEETTQAVRDAINTFLAAQGDIPVAPGIVIPADVNNFEQLCVWLTENAPLELTQTQIDDLIDSFVNANPGLSRAAVEALVDCFIDADIIDVVTPTCDGCFAALDANILTTINNLLAASGPIPLPAPIDYTIPASVNNTAQLCVQLNLDNIEITEAEISLLVNAFIGLIGPGSDTIAQALVDCLIEAGVIDVSATTSGLTASNINTADPTASFSQPTIAQGTEDDLTAMEKITKLKTQWLDGLH